MRENTVQQAFRFVWVASALSITGCGSSTPAPYDPAPSMHHSRSSAESVNSENLAASPTPTPKKDGKPDSKAGLKGDSKDKDSKDKDKDSKEKDKDKKDKDKKDKDFDSDDEDTPKKEDKKPKPKSAALLKKLELYSFMAQNGVLTCPIESQCDPALVLISLVAEDGVKRCSGFLIGPDKVMTSDHCVSKNEVVKEACKGNVFFHFSKAGKTGLQRTVGCESIEARSKEKGLLTKDYAIFKLTQEVKDREPYTVATRPFKSKEMVTIPRVQMTTDEKTHHYNGVQMKVNCPVSDHTVLHSPIAVDATDIMTLGDCPIQPGNSGSPVLNSDGEVGAVLQGFLSYKQDESEKSANFLKLRLDGVYGPLGVATQLRCVSEVSSSTAGCPEYDVTDKKSISSYLEDIKFDPSIIPELENDWVWMRARSFEDDKLYISVPKCVTPNQRKFGFNAIRLHYRRGINRFLQGEWRVEGKAGTEFIDYSPGSVGFDRDITFNSNDYGTLNLKLCP